MNTKNYMNNQNQDSALKKNLIFLSILDFFLLTVLFFEFRKAIPINQLLPITLLFGLFISVMFPVILYKRRQFISRYRNKYIKIFFIISITLITINVIWAFIEKNGMSFSDYFINIGLGSVLIFYLVERAKKTKNN